MNRNKDMIMDQDDLYQFEYNRRFPKEKDNFKYTIGNTLKNIGKYRKEEEDKTGKKSSGVSYLLGGITEGIGEGLTRDEDARRAEEMSDITKLTGDIVLGTNQLKQQLINSEKNKYDLINVVKSIAPNIRQYSEAKYQGDLEAENAIGKGIIDKLRNAGKVTGEFLSARDGNLVVLDENGADSMHIADMIAQSGINPIELFGDDADRVLSQLSPGAMDKYNQRQMLSQAELDKRYSEAMQSSNKADLLRKQNENYLSDEDKLQIQDRNAYNQRVAENNKQYISSNLLPAYEGRARLLNTYNKIYKIVKENPSLTGGRLVDTIRRSFIKQLGLNLNLDKAKYNSIEFEKALKPILGAQLAEKEGERLLSKFVNLESDPRATLEYLEVEIPKLNNEVNNIKDILNDYRNNPYDDILNEKLFNIEQVLNADIDNRVKMVVPDGSIRLIPREKVEEAIKYGARVFNNG